MLIYEIDFYGAANMLLEIETLEEGNLGLVVQDSTGQNIHVQSRDLLLQVSEPIKIWHDDIFKVSLIFNESEF